MAKEAEIVSPLINVDGVAALLGVSRRHVYTLMDRGALPAPIKLGASSRWNRRALEKWIDGGCKPPRRLKPVGK